MYSPAKGIWILDDYFSEELARAASMQFPSDDWPNWFKYPGSGKLVCPDSSLFPEPLLWLTQAMLQLPIKVITQTLNTFADFSLHGAGLHAMPEGIKLGSHLDANLHPRQDSPFWFRAINAILYLNEDWHSSQGGAFILDREDSIPFSIKPKFNRLVLFDPTDKWHSVDTNRSTETRKSLTVFYWTTTRNQSTPRAQRLRSEFANEEER